MKVSLYWACALACTLLVSCGGEKPAQEAEKKAEAKTEAKTETPEKKEEKEEKEDEPKEKKQDKGDYASKLVGKWELVEAFGLGGEKMKNVKSTITLGKTSYSEVKQHPDQPLQNLKGTWKLDPTRKNEEGALDAIIFNCIGEGEYPWNLMSVTDTELVLVFFVVPEKYIYKRK
jgi:hypothetical protein